MSSSADDIAIQDGLTAFQVDAANSHTPMAYIRAIRIGTIGSRHRVTVHGTAAAITIRAHSTSAARDAVSFTELVAAMNAAVTDGIQPDLPPEIGMVVWQHRGREVRICAPGTAPALRRARIRRRLTALSPLPLLGALIQPVAGSATAVGIAVAPIPPMHAAPPSPPITRELTREIAWPPPPWLPAEHPVHTDQPGPLAPPTLPAPPYITSSDAAPPPARTRRQTAATAPKTPTPTPTAKTAAATDAEPTATPSPDPAPTLDATPTDEPTKRAHPHKKHRKQHPPSSHGRRH